MLYQAVGLAGVNQSWNSLFLLSGFACMFSDKYLLDYIN